MQGELRNLSRFRSIACLSSRVGCLEDCSQLIYYVSDCSENQLPPGFKRRARRPGRLRLAGRCPGERRRVYGPARVSRPRARLRCRLGLQRVCRMQTMHL